MSLESLEDRWLLSTFTVTNLLDDGSVGSLRWAVNQVDQTAGANTINFDSSVFNTAKTITLTGTPLELSNTGGAETITGPAAGVTISGGGLSRVFEVDNLVTASLSGLTISGGNASSTQYGYGGGLFNYGTATLTNCTVSGNSGRCGRRRSGQRRHSHPDQLHRQRQLRALHWRPACDRRTNYCRA